MTKHNDHTPADASSDLPPHDELDALLHRWHTVNATRAAAGRDQLMARLASESAAAQPHAQPEPVRSATRAPAPLFRRFDVSTFRRFISPAFARLAASLAILAVLAVWLVPGPRGASFAQNGGVVLAPEAGRLDAFDAEGNLLGPCPLKHTDVNVDISAFFSRVTVRQTYANASQQKVETVYTFPLSHRGAVDRMTMTITPPDGTERVVVGEVKERELARQIYESAREQGYVASLLEQERPNIFTQSVANIEPGANVVVEISYVETLESRDGEYHFEFPMVVGPRYIPGYPQSGAAGGDLPRAIKPRPGLILLGPATMVIGQAGDVAKFGTLQGGKLETLLNNARPIAAPGGLFWERALFERAGDAHADGRVAGTIKSLRAHDSVLIEIDRGADNALAEEMTGTIVDGDEVVGTVRLSVVDPGRSVGEVTAASPDKGAKLGQQVWFNLKPENWTPAGPTLWHAFEALYCDGSKELGTIHTDGTGQLNGRWFYIDPRKIEQIAHSPIVGTGYEPNTNLVPDASRISPMPVKPPTRAGHDISLKVNIDTGGPAILDVKSELHQIKDTLGPRYKNLGNRASYALSNDGEIPNRDFMLSWRTNADSIQEAQFAHTDPRGNFFTLILAPPARVDEAAVRGRELVFVMDTSGSMSGLPIEKSKAVINKAIDTMRDRDTFNIITFSGATAVLWDRPRPATAENRASAQAFISGRQGSGGTEMMKAIEAALVQQPRDAGPGGIAGADRRALTPLELANLPADGREVTVTMKARDLIALLQDGAAPGVVDIKVRDGLALRAQIEKWTLHESFDADSDQPVVIRGEWSTRDGQRLLRKGDALYARDAADALAKAAPPMRICVFLTDGYVGNDMAIIDAVKHNAATTRVFSFGIGNSVNRYLLDSMARAGRGEVEYVSLEGDADAAVQRLVTRIEKPVLTDIQLAFGPGIEVTDTIPPLDAVPDLFDVEPLIIHGRYTRTSTAGEAPAKTTLTIRGRTGAGAYERTLDVSLPREQNDHDVIATLWARAKAESLMNQDLASAQEGNIAEPIRKAIIALGEQFGIVTQFTSFVAVEKSRMTIGGKPVLVAVPIELPAGTDWEGFFGGEHKQDEAARLGYGLQGGDFLAGNIDVNGVIDGYWDGDPGFADIQYGVGPVGAPIRTTTGQSPIGLPDSATGINGSELVNRIADLGVTSIGGIAMSEGAHSERVPSSVTTPKVDSVGLANDFQIAQPSTVISVRGTPITIDWGKPSSSAPGSAAAGLSASPYPERVNVAEAFGQRPDKVRVNMDALRRGTDPRVFTDGQADPFINHSGVNSLDDPRHGYKAPGSAADGAGNWTSYSMSPRSLFSGASDGGGSGSGGGGTGGRGGASGGGGLFGGADSRATGPEALAHEVLELVTMFVHFDDWDTNGGALASVRCLDHRFVFQALQDSEAARKVVDDGRAFLAYLQQRIPELAALGPVDAGASKPFADSERIVVYDVRDLTSTGPETAAERMQRVMDVLTRTVDPDGWDVNGGDQSHITAIQGRLVIINTPENHRAIDELLAALRSVEAGASKPVGDSEKIVIYDVRDLLPPPGPESPTEVMKQVMDVLTQTVDPDGWEVDGGDRSQVREFEGRLVITSTAENHRAIGQLLAEIRAARNARVQAMHSQRARMRAHLFRVLDERLIAMFKEASTEKPAAEAPPAAEAGKDGMQLTDGRAMVTVLVEKVNDETKRALTGAGMRVEDASAKPPLVVGWVNPRDLGAVAFVEGVRRVEPTR